MSLQRDSAMAEGIASSVTNLYQSSLLGCVEKLCALIPFSGAQREYEMEILEESGCEMIRAVCQGHFYFSP